MGTPRGSRFLLWRFPVKKWLRAYLYYVLAFNVLTYTCPPFRRRVEHFWERLWKGGLKVA